MEVDLINADAAPRGHENALRDLLAMSFAMGGRPGIGEELTRTEPVERHSPFDPEAFERGLFVENLVDAICPGLTRKLSRKLIARELLYPTTDLTVIALRQAVFSELLDDAELESATRALAISLDALFGLFENEPQPSEEGLFTWQVFVLRELQTTCEKLGHVAFARADSSLGRLHDVADSLREDPGYRRLGEFLSFIDDATTLDVRMRVGIDGRTTAMEIVKSAPNAHRPFSPTMIARVWRSLRGWFMGHRFSENQILHRLSEKVFEETFELLVVLSRIRLDLDFYLAGLTLRRKARRAGLSVSLPSFTRSARAYEGLWNPLLLLAGIAPIACDVAFSADEKITIVTGPNSGGKTRLLQAIALTQLLGQAGFFVPARSANLSMAQGLFFSLLEEAKFDSQEGRLGAELGRVRALFEHARPHTLVLMDELCSGTNPSEAEEIFELVVELLPELEPQAIVTTHFLDFAKRIASKEPSSRDAVGFLRVLLDEDLAPTYAFERGVAESSLARRTAERLGVTRSELVRLVKRAKLREETLESDAEDVREPIH